ncbi:NADPH:quinone reductase [Cellulomonas chitinilytica]|uniref:NADPH:quinone reductase n=1 Tax=Cellulomonas chitinilytica TaxID=398759 RepID=A0A919NZS1_9CELL|nr:zinc-binding dehydrogenase [Cellulomonas chitinilytica]GIG20673.1 NADPH:quinone reductase [Cellulomonas chitinilytica]
MSVLTIPAFGATELVDRDPARPGPGEVRVRVEAAPVHPADVWVHDGRLAALLPGTPPYTPGWGVAGVVDEVGPDVEDLAPGDAVLGLSDWFDTFVGTHASTVVLPARAVGRRPATLDAVAAAALSLNALTALQALDLIGLTSGTLGITGAAGGVGGYALELARLRGLDVVALARESDREFVERAGAHLAVRPADAADTAKALTAVAGRLDAVLDAALLVGPALAAVRNNGVLVAVTGPATPQAERGVRVETVHVVGNGTQLTELAGLAADGTLSTRVAATYPLVEAERAYRAVLAGGLRGAVVLVP